MYYIYKMAYNSGNRIDPDLIPENIKNGVNIFGVNGTLIEESGLKNWFGNGHVLLSMQQTVNGGLSSSSNLKLCEKIGDYIYALGYGTGSHNIYWGSININNGTINYGYTDGISSADKIGRCSSISKYVIYNAAGPQYRIITLNNGTVSTGSVINGTLAGGVQTRNGASYGGKNWNFNYTCSGDRCVIFIS